jgi:hypothetical protein
MKKFNSEFVLVLERKSNLNAVREYARRGSPTSLRGKLWSTMLDVELSNWVDKDVDPSFCFIFFFSIYHISII